MTFAEILTEHGGIAEADLGKYLKKDTNGKYTTFLDYSTHSFNFYYMERGSGSSVCCMNFNFPLLKKNAISVTKENITVDENNNNTNTEVLGNPDYYFNIMGEAGTNSSYLFIGPESTTDIYQYKVKDVDGKLIKSEDGITDQIYETDQWGIFKLKAGQTAIFENIPENAGGFYVQELIKAADNDQYPNVYVNEIPVRYKDMINWKLREYFSPVSEDTYIGPYGTKWYGRSGHHADASTNTSFYFEQQNHVNTEVLGSLAITKVLEGENQTDKVFEMEVLLDGMKLPAGTKYKIGDTNYTVQTEGIIPLKAGQTAVISNIISGTQFTVREVNGGDYTVTYDVLYNPRNETQNEAQTVEESFNDGSSISGVVHVNTDVMVTVTNAEQGVTVQIPVIKKFTVNGNSDTQHQYTFKLEQVTDINGKELVANGTVLEKDVSFAGNEYRFNFDLSYLKHNITGTSQKFYYRLTEVVKDGSSLPNNQVYVVEVTVTKTETGLQASITRILSDDSDVVYIEFINTLIGSLGIEKIVAGLTDAEREQAAFKFDIYLLPGSSGVQTLPTAYEAVFKQASGNEETVTLAFTDGKISLSEFHHGESAIIKGIPIGTTWKIVEREYDGYNVTNRVVNGEILSNNNVGAESSGSIVLGDTNVIYTNTAGYELPESGGAGTTLYTMAGLMLVLCSAAFLLCRYQKRRKEAK